MEDEGAFLAMGKEELPHLRNCRSKHPHPCFSSTDASSPLPLQLVEPLPWDQPSYAQKRCSTRGQDCSIPDFAPHPRHHPRSHHLRPPRAQLLSAFSSFLHLAFPYSLHLTSCCSQMHPGAQRRGPRSQRYLPRELCPWPRRGARACEVIFPEVRSRTCASQPGGVV